MNFNIIDAKTANATNVSVDSLRAVSNWHRDMADHADTERTKGNAKSKLDATRSFFRHTVQADILDVVISKMN